MKCYQADGEAEAQSVHVASVSHASLPRPHAGTVADPCDLCFRYCFDEGMCTSRVLAHVHENELIRLMNAAVRVSKRMKSLKYSSKLRNVGISYPAEFDAFTPKLYIIMHRTTSELQS